MNKNITWLMIACFFVFVNFADAQQRKKIRQIGVLSPASLEASPLMNAFHQGLSELGYIEGQNISVQYRFTDGDPESLRKLAAELADLKVDVILTINTPASQAAKTVTKTIPIVFTYVADATEVVASLARPGGNITGLTTLAAELSGKRLELIKETVPGISRVAYLWSSTNPTATSIFTEAERASPRLGIRLQPLKVQDPDEFDNAFKSATARSARVIFVWEDALLLPHRARILDLAAKHRLATSSQYREFAEAGGLLSYGPSLPEQFRRAAYYVDKILKGAKPADTPVERPAKFELVINLKTAKQIGLTIPPDLLSRADKVVR